MSDERCEHVTSASVDPAIRADTDVCAECVALGDEWVELRVCKTCGHVGCCNRSKNKHAQAHWRSVGHPIMGPAAPASGFADWLWCFEHDGYVLRSGRIKRPEE